MVIKASYKNNVFKLESNIIPTDDTTFELTSDINMEGFLYITFHNKEQKTIQLTKTNNNLYRGRLKLYSEELHLLVADATINLCIYTSIKTVVTNSDTIKFDLPTINNLIKLDSNSEILQLKKEIRSIKDSIWKLSTNRTLSGVPNIDTSYAEPGMIPVLMTKDGTFVLKHPFANIIESINNVYPEKGNVTITADNIKIQDMILSEYLIMVSKVIAQQNSYSDALKQQITNLNQEIKELKLKLQAHISNPII